MLIEDEADTSMMDILKSVNIKDAVYMSAQAWYDLPATTLVKSWHKILGDNEETATEPTSLPTSEFQPLFNELNCELSDGEITEWLYEEEDPGYQKMK